MPNIRAVEFASRIFNPYKIFAPRKYHCALHHFYSAFSLCEDDKFSTMRMMSPIGDTVGFSSGDGRQSYFRVSFFLLFIFISRLLFLAPPHQLR
ncbi:hypothetical protein [Herbaspirillum lusitanum]|uniref:hypothetical protein n=1 Tax=Herbaspirillum lusitanum TaxID=213312 RepID=UPI0012F481E5|nr:hypothetical protein [Herbaspirillum lusitanum]